jgi:uncharacterized protein
MIERDGYPAGVPCWVDTLQPNPDAAAAFYRDLFGWELEPQPWIAGEPGRYFIGKLWGRDVAGIGPRREDAPGPPTWNTYVWVESADDATAKVRGAGGSVVMDSFDVLDSGRMAVVADPEGAVFCVWQAKNHKGAQLVNESGTWNFSDLSTRDPEGAMAFYGAVFGWEASSFSIDGTDFMMWRLPGYGEFLERTIDPEIRTRQKESGAPEGFEDAVAWLAPMTSDQAPEDVAAHWGVTFAVDDADAMAGRAEELGGAVTAPPFDAGPTRAAVLTDPQGAGFTVSTYDPESG